MHSSSKITRLYLAILLSYLFCQGYSLESEDQSSDASNSMVGLLNLIMQQAFSNALDSKTANDEVSSVASVSTLSPNERSQSSHNYDSAKTSGTPTSVIMIDIEPEAPSKSDDATMVQVQKSDSTAVDEKKLSHKIFTKTVRVNRVEEIFEDLFENNRRRVVKEDRFERIEVSKDKEMDKYGSEFDYDDIFTI